MLFTEEVWQFSTVLLGEISYGGGYSPLSLKEFQYLLEQAKQYASLVAVESSRDLTIAEKRKKNKILWFFRDFSDKYYVDFKLGEHMGGFTVRLVTTRTGRHNTDDGWGLPTS